jgi:hypothetical protein
MHHISREDAVDRTTFEALVHALNSDEPSQRLDARQQLLAQGTEVRPALAAALARIEKTSSWMKK